MQNSTADILSQLACRQPREHKVTKIWLHSLKTTEHLATNFSPKSGSQEFTSLNPKPPAPNIIPTIYNGCAATKTAAVFLLKLPTDGSDLSPLQSGGVLIQDVTATITGNSAHLSDYTQLTKKTDMRYQT